MRTFRRGHVRDAARVAWAAALVLCAASLCGCGDNLSPGGGADAASVDSQAPSSEAGGAMGDAADAAPSCEGLPNVEGAAGEATASIEAEMAAAGCTRQPLGSGAEVTPTAAEIEAVSQEGGGAPGYFDDESAILALPATDSLRRAYTEGDITAPDWATQGLLATWELSPYTDTLAYACASQLIVHALRLEACLSPVGATYPPHERVRRWAFAIPRVSEIIDRRARAFFALRQFPADPAWQRHPASPLINRSGGNGIVVQAADGLHMWLNGYSAASGIIFHATSVDGVSWDFAWDTAHACVFQNLPDFTYWKRDPSVLYRDGAFTMWFTSRDMSYGTPERVYVATSADGLTWPTPHAIWVHPVPLPDSSAPFVMHDDTQYQLFAHRLDGSGILHATSADGIDWQLDAAPVLLAGTSIDDMDGFGVYQPWVLREGSSWVMFFLARYGARDVYQSHLALAASDDGVTWQKLTQPVLNQDLTPGGWESGEIGRPAPFPRGSECWLYYSGGEGGEPSVGLAIGPSCGP